jgi:solute carrier family 25 aspartate/glutamate transporter 12/13
LQVHGELAGREGTAPLNGFHVARQLGLLGLYKGSVSCLLRDVPFAAIYFPTFAHVKKDFFLDGQNGRILSFWETLAAASIAYVLSRRFYVFLMVIFLKWGASIFSGDATRSDQD